MTAYNGKVDGEAARQRKARQDEDATGEQAAAEARALEEAKSIALSRIAPKHRREPRLSRQISVDVPADQHARISDHARRENMTLRAFVLVLLQPFLEK